MEFVESRLLRQELGAFARKNSATQYTNLPELVSLVQMTAATGNSIGVNIIGVMPEQGSIQRSLKQALGKVLKTPFKKHNGTTEIPWIGGYTVVALTPEGAVVGAQERAEGPAYRVYRQPLYRHALTKAIMGLHLFYAELPGGIEKNWEYLKGAMPIGDRRLSQGDIVTDIIGMDNYPTRLIIGASGCGLSSHYQEALAPGMLKSGATDFMTGYANTQFLRVLESRLRNPKLGTTPYPEPDRFSQLSRSH